MKPVKENEETKKKNKFLGRGFSGYADELNSFGLDVDKEKLWNFIYLGPKSFLEHQQIFDAYSLKPDATRENIHRILVKADERYRTAVKKGLKAEFETPGKTSAHTGIALITPEQRVNSIAEPMVEPVREPEKKPSKWSELFYKLPTFPQKQQGSFQQPLPETPLHSEQSGFKRSLSPDHTVQPQVQPKTAETIFAVDKIPVTEKSTQNTSFDKPEHETKTVTLSGLEAGVAREPQGTTPDIHTHSIKPEVISPTEQDHQEVISGYNTPQTNPAKTPEMEPMEVEIKVEVEHPPEFEPDKSESSLMTLSTQFPGFSNPNGKLCYINSAIQFLRATLPAEISEKLIRQWATKQKEQPACEPGNATEALAALLSSMNNPQSDVNKINQARDQLIIVCRSDAGFSDPIHSDRERLLMAGLSDNSQTNSAAYDQIAQNDPDAFLLRVMALLNEPALFNISTTLKTLVDDIEYRRKTTANDEPTSHLTVSLSQTGSVDDCITRFCKAPDPVEGVSWDPDMDCIEGSEHKKLVKGAYASWIIKSLVLRKGRNETFSVLLKRDKQSLKRDRNSKRTIQHLTENVFNRISVPVEIEHEGLHSPAKAEAEPKCILAYHGTTPASGHFVTLIKQHNEWLLLEDDQPPEELPCPGDTLKQRQFCPYIIQYRVSEIVPEPVIQ